LATPPPPTVMKLALPSIFAPTKRVGLGYIKRSGCIVIFLGMTDSLLDPPLGRSGCSERLDPLPLIANQIGRPHTLERQGLDARKLRQHTAPDFLGLRHLL